MKIVIVGGHLSPALAVLEALPKKTEVFFIGRKYTFEGDKTTSLEYNTIRSLRIPFVEISTGRLQRKFTRYTIPSLLKIPYGFFQAFLILSKFKPDVVLGFGGYLSLPVILGAYILQIPIVIHEQTLEAGLANKIASYFATKVCISWESSRKFFPKDRTLLTGNPIRKFLLSFRLEWRDLHQQTLLKEIPLRQLADRNDTTIIYITGGSSGSHFINTLVEECLQELLQEFVVIHQTGDSQEYRDFDRLEILRDSLPLTLKNRYILEKFIDNKELGAVYKSASLVVSRAGMNTVTELIYFGKLALLIPLGFSQNNEQMKNALFFKSLGLGEVLEQKYLTSDMLLQKLREMLHNRKKYAKNKNKAARLINESSAQKLIEVVEYVKKKKKAKIIF